MTHEVEGHGASDLEEGDHSAQLAVRHDVVNHPPEARACALDILCVDIAVAVLIEPFGERPLAHLRWEDPLVQRRRESCAGLERKQRPPWIRRRERARPRVG